MISYNFNNAFHIVEHLVAKNATHIKRHTKLQDATDQSILEHAKEEIQELMDAPDDIYEMADIMAILFHYMVKKGWTIGEVSEAITEKLRMRFKVVK